MEQEIGYRQLQPAAVIIITLVAIFLGMQVVGPMIGIFFAIPFYDGNLIELTAALQEMKDPGINVPLYIIQGSATFFGLIVVPFVLFKVFRRSATALFQQQVWLQAAVMVVVLVVVFMGVNSIFIEWNQKLELPEAFAGLEQQLKSLEEQLKNLTEFLTHFDSPAQLILALIVIAVLPGIGEELVFRGIIQNEFYRGTKNIHLSIWVSAAIFSAIHMQFYGFVPRLMLGALFGYIYFWSGSLPLAMLAHFVNNGLMVVAMYLYQQGTLDVDMESPESAPWPAVAFSAVISVLLLYAFKKFHQGKGTGSPAPPEGVSSF